jgi:phosphoglycolate phosphatase-like HAD superfamily hydrolase
MPLCFDLDGTIGSFDGGYRLLRQALGDLWGAPPTPEDLSHCHGSTDWEIVGQLFAMRFGGTFTEAAYAEYDRAVLARFTTHFHPDANQPKVFKGIIAGMARLADAGHRVWLVSGNTQSVLEFKARLLGVDPRIPRLGSLPHLDRAGLIRRALEGCPGPHLYVGDRPHDRLAAQAAGVPFIGVGALVPGDHPILEPEAEAEHLVATVTAIFRASAGGSASADCG